MWGLPVHRDAGECKDASGHGHVRHIVAERAVPAAELPVAATIRNRISLAFYQLSQKH